MTTVEDTDLILPRVWDDLWAEHGPAIKAAQLAVLEAQAATEDAMGAAG